MTEGLTPDQVQINQLRTMLDSQIELRKVAERLYNEARDALQRLATLTNPGAMEEHIKASHRGTSVLDVGELGRIAETGHREKISDLQIALTVDPQEVDELRQEIKRLQALVDRRQAFAPPTQAEEPPGQVFAQTDVSTSVSSQTRARANWMRFPSPSPTLPATPVNAWPEWAQRWRDGSGNFDRDVDVIIVMGDTGAVRREDISTFLSEWWDVTPKSGSINRALARVRDDGLVETIPSRRKTSRHPRHLHRLTERGRDAYRLLRGRDPVPSLTTELLKRHKSPEHAMLNLEAALAFEEAGGSVDLLPESIQLSSGSYRPDLVLTTPAGEVFYVECERGTYKNPEKRVRKWELYYEASEGRFFVVTEGKEDRRTIKEEIEAWAGDRPLQLWVPNIAEENWIWYCPMVSLGVE
ncbi:MAG: hypothetical protein GF350_16830 [Chitinivibrionales bacterium]|nr:hypothetical protein [Chitinivibrionales bacterium]